MQNPKFLQICPPKLQKLAAKKCYYTIVAPKIVKPNSDFAVNLTIHSASTLNLTSESEDATVVRVSIEDEDVYNGFKIHRDITMKPNETEVVTIPVDNLLLDRNYMLIVRGLSGISMEHQSSLELLTKTYAILIQTDKALYKPKDSIKFRVLVLDDELKAASINEKELCICLIVSLVPFFFIR